MRTLVQKLRQQDTHRTRTIDGRYARRDGAAWVVYDAHTGQPTGETFPLMPTI